MKRSIHCSAAAVLMLFACSPEFEVEGDGEGEAVLVDEPRPTDFREAVSAEQAPPPISGGSLLITRAGGHAVMGDTDTDTVRVIDLRSAEPIATIAFDRLSQPGRLVEDEAGLVHVALRRSGEILTLDPETGEHLGLRYVCPNPRGLAVDDHSATLFVACAGGNLAQFDLTLPDSGPTFTFVAPDLRDVLVIDGQLYVSLFHRAEVLHLDDTLAIEKRWTAPNAKNNNSGATAELSANTAWRTIADHTGGYFMLHQASANENVVLDDFEAVTASSSYGGSVAAGRPCHSLVASVLSHATGDGLTQTTGALHQTVLAVDAALSPGGDVLAVAVAGQSDRNAPTLERQRSVLLVETTRLGDPNGAGCSPALEELDVEGQPISVAYTPDGWLLVQTRAPASLFYLAPGANGFIQIDLDKEAVRDTGFDLFHGDAGAGIACASCHPEGGEDGLVWTFEGVGPRRTQALHVGLRGTEPLHWEGDMDDFSAIVGEVHLSRMGGAHQTEERLLAFEDWLLDLPPPPPFRAPSDASAERGRTLFGTSGCADCHRGSKLTNNETVQLQGLIALQVPSLVAAAHRAPYMHDGRSVDLRGATVDMLERTGRPARTDAELDDIVAYLESL